MTHYETMFQMKENSDIAARIEFNMGTNASPVWFGNVRLEEIESIPFNHDGPKAPLGSGNHLYNGTFDLGEPNRMSYWHVETANGATATAKVDDKGKLNVQIGGSESDEVRLLQKEFSSYRAKIMSLPLMLQYPLHVLPQFSFLEKTAAYMLSSRLT